MKTEKLKVIKILNLLVLTYFMIINSNKIGLVYLESLH
jgi:hypothetical protein